MLDHISFGKDICRIRYRLQRNLDFLELPSVKKELDAFIKELIEARSTNANNKYLDLTHSISRAVCFITLKEIFLYQLRATAKHPFRVHPLSVFLVEWSLALESNESVSEEVKFLGNDFLRLAIMEFGKAFEAHWLLGHFWLLRLHAETREDHPEYSLLFAYTLRQQPLDKVADFLRSKQRWFRGDYCKFLINIIREFAEEKQIITTVHADEVLEWVNAEFSKKDTVVTPYSYLSKHTLPKGWIKIPGRLKSEAIQHFFSFFFLEKNGAAQALLTEEETIRLLKHGFAYPLDPQKVEMFTLRTSTKLPKSFVYYMFYHLQTHYIPREVMIDYKDHFAWFLKNRFTNFSNLSLGAIKNSIRDRRPACLRRSFELVDYFELLQKGSA